MLFVENLSIETLIGRKLIEKLSFYLNNGDKLAIIGEEGNGKSTLMKAIVNEKLITDYCHVSGKIFSVRHCLSHGRKWFKKIII